jgi:hypothetical protein
VDQRNAIRGGARGVAADRVGIDVGARWDDDAPLSRARRVAHQFQPRVAILGGSRGWRRVGHGGTVPAAYRRVA